MWLKQWKTERWTCLMFSTVHAYSANQSYCHCLTVASEHLLQVIIFPLPWPKAVRNMGHKGKHSAVRVCPRGFRMSPSMSLILSPSSHHISPFPAEGESPSPYHLWSPKKPEAQFVITVGQSYGAASCRPQSTVIYKIVLILPTFYGSHSSRPLL